jgi:succinate-acetate transporter protein
MKINRENVQIGGKNSSSTFVFTVFISFGLFNIFHENICNSSAGAQDK